MSVSFLRQLDIFDPSSFFYDCHVIGCGAVGSRLAECLVRLGVKNLNLYDADFVDSHNVPTGIFTPEQEGMHKVWAINNQLSCLASHSGCEITMHPFMITADVAKEEGLRGLQGIVFLCVDTMSARREIWETCIKRNPGVCLMIEIRIGGQEGRIYTVLPCDLLHIRSWEEVSQYRDEDSPEPACTNRAVITTVNVAVGLAVQQLILWHRKSQFSNSIVFGLDGTPLLSANTW